MTTTYPIHLRYVICSTITSQVFLNHYMFTTSIICFLMMKIIFLKKKFVNRKVFFNDFVELKIKWLISSLKPSSSKSFDNIKSNVLQIAHVLWFIFNSSIYKGIFPSKLKTAIVIPLHKKGDVKKCHYSPIFLFCFFF